MDASTADFHKRLAEHRAWREVNMPHGQRLSPAVSGGSHWSSPWHCQKFGHVNVCREIASETLLAESLIADIPDERIARVVHKFNQRLRSGRYNERALLVVHRDSGPWRARVEGVRPRSVSVETIDVLSTMAFDTAWDASEWLKAHHHWVVRIDLVDE